MVAGALSKAGVFEAPLFEALARESKLRVSQFKAENLAYAMWAFTTVCLLDTLLLVTLEVESEVRVGNFNA